MLARRLLQHGRGLARVRVGAALVGAEAGEGAGDGLFEHGLTPLYRNCRP